ncbi:ESX secretion-associated protein EspG [Mycobacterium paragordonae]|uniref:ESX-2 secretion-associated protein EspG2 n=1 Tax=Mycobacterium paragordonae TaxID=1389713 RepID=A0ABQ1CFG8_9MYCO|nr:ESX secretion-associated protein EspG [Mycobacterium paragordonae]GFG83233.1 ESX-2 secretion-associated protein EspG2 [Mycobacterium paragordonae]
MLATTLDGLWALQVFTGIEALCPELGLRPHLPRAELERPAMAMRHPAVSELVNCGAVTLGGGGPTVDRPIVEALTVISRREVAVMMLIHHPDADVLPQRVALSRFGQWWVSLARFGDDTVLIRPMGTATSREAAAVLIAREIEAVCGVNKIASFEPMTVATERLLALTSAPEGLERVLREEGASADQMRAGLALANAGRSAQCSVVGLQSTQAAPVVTDHVVTVGDTECGRVMVKNLRRQGQRWSVLAPGATHHINTAIVELLSSLPSGNDWYRIQNLYG